MCNQRCSYKYSQKFNKQIQYLTFFFFNKITYTNQKHVYTKIIFVKQNLLKVLDEFSLFSIGENPTHFIQQACVDQSLSSLLENHSWCVIRGSTTEDQRQMLQCQVNVGPMSARQHRIDVLQTSPTVTQRWSNN